MFMILAVATASLAWADDRGHPRSLDECDANNEVILNSTTEFNDDFYLEDGDESNCGRRPTPEYIYELNVEETGLYSFSLYEEDEDGYMYILTGCCDGDQLYPRGLVEYDDQIRCMYLVQGTYYLIIEGEGEYEIDIETCEDPCTSVQLEDGFSYEGNQVVFVETVNENSSSPNYSGPWLTSGDRCQEESANPDGEWRGFGYYNWYNQDFGWEHYFNASLVECEDFTIDSAFVVICAYENDYCFEEEGPRYTSYCQWDEVHFETSGDVAGILNPNAWPGSNLSVSETKIVVPVSDLLDGQLEVWIDFDAGSDQCAWATEVWSSKLVVFGSCRQLPPEPEGYDLGDLPPLDENEEPCYPTNTPESGGPANAVFAPEDQVAWLGPCVNHEQFPNIVDNDGCDDGIYFVPTERPGGAWYPGDEVCVDVTITTGPAYQQGTPLYIWGWKDGNLDCDFDDFFVPQEGDDNVVIRECIIDGYEFFAAGPNSVWTERICFTDPGVLDFGLYDGYLRFRLLSCGGQTPDRNGDPCDCLTAQTYVDDALGETEDYIVADLQLPVELLSFTASGANGRVVLNWATATENQNDAFEVQKWDNTGWRRTGGLIDGAGTSGTQNTYHYIDREVTAGQTCRYRLVTIDVNGTRMTVGEVESLVEPLNTVVEEYALHQNYPNPFNPSTQISYDLAGASKVSLKVFDLLGREVISLVDGTQTAGRYTVSFDAASLPSGMYFYRLETAEFTDMKKMMLLK